MSKSNDFFEYVDLGEKFPEDAVYPKGRIFPYMGYSGVNEQDARNGFSVAGHKYGLQKDQKKHLASAKAAGLPCTYGIGLEGSFFKDPPLTYTEEQLRKTIREQVLEVVEDPAIAWWYVHQEELRMWRGEEEQYLRLLTETIRENDPYDRPIFMYEPNNRRTVNLVKSGKYLDIIGKGCYCNRVGRQDERIWLRWGIEQEVAACAELEKEDGRPRTPIVMPQMSQDPPDPALDPMIPVWARHDTYLGLMTGGKGVVIFSLFPRDWLKRTFKEHYQAYSQIGKELTGELALGQVFLFGEDKNDLTVSQLEGIREVELNVVPKNKVEDYSMTEDEKKEYFLTYPALSSREISYRGKRYLFVCNTSIEPMVCTVQGIPSKDVTVEELFAGETVQPLKGSLKVALGPWGTKCFRISKTE